MGCMECGEGHPACLDFHHKDPTEKAFAISRGGGRSRESFLAEIAKCDLLCANCHRKRHFNEKTAHHAPLVERLAVKAERDRKLRLAS
jgi:hypothetical protein